MTTAQRQRILNDIGQLGTEQPKPRTFSMTALVLWCLGSFFLGTIFTVIFQIYFLFFLMMAV